MKCQYCEAGAMFNLTWFRGPPGKPGPVTVPYCGECSLKDALAKRGMTAPVEEGHDYRLERTKPEEKMTAADQEGQGISPHWKNTAGSGKQHWDWMWDFFGPIWFICNVTKYVMRYRFKDGMKDLYKCRNYLNKLIEKEEAKTPTKMVTAFHSLPPEGQIRQLLESIAQEEFIGREVLDQVKGPLRHYLPGTSGKPLCGVMMRDDTAWSVEPALVTCPECCRLISNPLPSYPGNPRLESGRLLCGCWGEKCEGHPDTPIGEAS